ncbi:unnamed protein product [Dicrocoelium dendriticum]|nr:unnamed protein product [Dicrocoelium dendriticum]
MDFPSVLQYGDTLEIKAEAGKNFFYLSLLSDYLAFDPVQIAQHSDLENCLPMVPTQPLEIRLEINGCWDVTASSPEVSTISHGTTVRRYGFRSGEVFTCTIVIGREQFEINLNKNFLASSEHLIPVGSIHGMKIEGDCVIRSILYGHPIAIEHHYRVAEPNPVSCEIVECHLNLGHLLSDAVDSDKGDNFNTHEHPHDSLGFTRIQDINSLADARKSQSHATKSTSYQLAFSQEYSEGEDYQVDMFHIGLTPEKP